ncbi:MAG: hypothetical protein LBT53_09705, partial [Puniceicoccales bacterium]|nr:hypothetical protein [Puniceicoccales bacterium]
MNTTAPHLICKRRLLTRFLARAATLGAAVTAASVAPDLAALLAPAAAATTASDFQYERTLSIVLANLNVTMTAGAIPVEGQYWFKTTTATGNTNASSSTKDTINWNRDNKGNTYSGITLVVSGGQWATGVPSTTGNGQILSYFMPENHSQIIGLSANPWITNTGGAQVKITGLNNFADNYDVIAYFGTDKFTTNTTVSPLWVNGTLYKGIAGGTQQLPAGTAVGSGQWQLWAAGMAKMDTYDTTIFKEGTGGAYLRVRDIGLSSGLLEVSTGNSGVRNALTALQVHGHGTADMLFWAGGNGTWQDSTNFNLARNAAEADANAPSGGAIAWSADSRAKTVVFTSNATVTLAPNFVEADTGLWVKSGTTALTSASPGGSYTADKIAIDSGATLQIGTSATDAVNIAATGEFVVNGTLTLTKNYTLASPLSGTASGLVSIAPATTTTLTSAQNTYSGGFDIANNATLRVTGDATLGLTEATAALNFAGANATLEIARDPTASSGAPVPALATKHALTGTGNVNLTSGAFSYAGNAASGITFNIGSYAPTPAPAPAPAAPAPASQTALSVLPTSQQLTTLAAPRPTSFTIATGANIAGTVRAGAATVTIEPNSTTAALLLANHSTLLTTASTTATATIGALTFNSPTDPSDSTFWELSGTLSSTPILSTNSLTINGASVAIDISKIYGSLAVGTYTLLQSTSPIANNTGADFRLTNLHMSANATLAQNTENITLTVNSTGFHRYIRTDATTSNFTDASRWTINDTGVNTAALTGDIYRFENTTPLRLHLAPDYTLRLVGNVATNFHLNDRWPTGPDAPGNWISPGEEVVGGQIVGLYLAGKGALYSSSVTISGGTIDTGTHGADDANSFAILIRSGSHALIIRSKVIGSGTIARVLTGNEEIVALQIEGDLSEYTGTIYGAGGNRGFTLGSGAILGTGATVSLAQGDTYSNSYISLKGDVDFGARVNKPVAADGKFLFEHTTGYVVRLTGTTPGWLSTIGDITWTTGGTIAINNWANLDGKNLLLAGAGNIFQLYGEDGTTIVAGNSATGVGIKINNANSFIKVGTSDPRDDTLAPVTIFYTGALTGAEALRKLGKGKLVLSVQPGTTNNTWIADGQIELLSAAMKSLGTSSSNNYIRLIRPDSAIIYNGLPSGGFNPTNRFVGSGYIVKKADGGLLNAANSLGFTIAGNTFSGGLYIESGRVTVTASGAGTGPIYISNTGKILLTRANADWTNNIFITGPGIPEPDNSMMVGAIRVDNASTSKLSGNITVVADPVANVYFSRINSGNSTGLRITGNIIGTEDVTLEFGEPSATNAYVLNHLLYLTGENADWLGTLRIYGEVGMSLSIGDGGNNGNLPNAKAILVSTGGKLIANTVRGAEANGTTLATGTDLIIGGNITGSGNFEKQGAGTAILTGVASDLGTGTITVSAGSLFITGGIKAASASVSSGAVLGVADGGTITGTVNIAAGATFASGLGIVTGNLNFTGASTVRTTAVGQHTIATGGTRSAKVTFDLGPLYTSLAEGLIERGETGTRNIALLGYGSTLNGALPSTDWDVSNSGTYRPTSTPTLSATAGLIKLDLAATPHVLQWSSGNWQNASAGWNVKTSGGTLNVGDPTAFYTGDTAFFTGSTASVNVAADVFPAAVIVENASGSTYTIGGTGKISGTGTKLYKDGTGTLTLSTANAYTGGTFVRSVPAGSTNSLIVNNASALGPGPVTLGNNALLDVSGAAADTNATTSGVRNAVIVNAPDVATVIMDKKDYELNTLFVGDGVVKLSAGATVSSGSATDASHIQFYTSSPDFTGEIHLSTWTVLYVQATDGNYRNTNFYLDGNFPVANRNDYRFSLKANTSVDTIYLGGSGSISFDAFTLFAKGIVRLDNPAFSTIGTADGAVPNGTVPNARLSSSSPDGRLVLGNHDMDSPLWVNIVIGNASTDYANAASYGKAVTIVKEGPGVVSITQAPLHTGGYIVNEGILVYGSKAYGRPTVEVSSTAGAAAEKVELAGRIIVNPKGEFWTNCYNASNTADVNVRSYTAVLVGDNQNSGILGANTYARISDLTLNGGTLYGFGSYDNTDVWGTWQLRDSLVVTADQLDPTYGLPLLDPATGEKLRAIDPQTGLPFTKENPLISYIRTDKGARGVEGIRIGYRLSVASGLFVFQVEEAAKLVVNASVRDDGNGGSNDSTSLSGIRKTGAGEMVLAQGDGDVSGNFTIVGGTGTQSLYRGPTFVDAGKFVVGRVSQSAYFVAKPEAELGFTDGISFYVVPSRIEIQSNAKLILDFASPWELNVASPIEGAGDIVKTGAGTVTLSTTVYLFGAAEINAGKFSIGAAGDLANISEVTLTGDTAIFEPLKNYG